jgi:hypothetical protein
VEPGINIRGSRDTFVIVATSDFDGQGIAPEPLNWVLFHVVLGDSERLEFLEKKQMRSRGK